MQSVGSIGEGRQGRRLRTNEAAGYLGLSASTLEKDRVNGRLAIPYLKLGKTVVYDTVDLDRWLESRRRLSTSDTSTKAA